MEKNRFCIKHTLLLFTIFCGLWMCFSLPLQAQTAPPKGAENLVLVVLGDSLTAGYGLPPGDGFTDRLEARLVAEGRAVTVVNAGVSGDTSAGGRARFDWSVGHNADALIVALGGNDALRGLPPAGLRDNLAAILERAKQRKLPVLLAGMMAPRNLGQPYITDFDAVYPALAAEYQVLLQPFFLTDVAGVARFNQPDFIHPNKAGVARMVENILPYVMQLLAHSDKPSHK